MDSILKKIQKLSYILPVRRWCLVVAIYFRTVRGRIYKEFQEIYQIKQNSPY
jgi:hypothetical protein